MMDPGPQAYGAGKVGGAFNIQNFVRKPHVFVRLLSLVSIIILLYHKILHNIMWVYIILYNIITEIINNISIILVDIIG